MAGMKLGLTVLLTVLVCTVVGCKPAGPNLAPVTGVVTLDGAPETERGLAVAFEPISGGHSSAGYTGENGEYELRYSFKLKGAVVGHHTVRITTRSPNQFGPPANWEEKVPARYNVDSELTAEVKEGPDVFNWDLTTD